VVFALIVAACGVFLAFAPELGAHRALGIAALLPARDAMAVGCGLAALGFAALALWHPSRPLAAPLALALVVVFCVNAATVVARGFRNPAPSPLAAGQLRVLEWNTNGNLVTPSVIAELAAREHANVVVLPEADPTRTAAQYREAFEAVGLPSTLFSAPSPAAQAAVVMTDAVAARYRVTGSGPDPRKTLVLEPDSGGLPRIVALHVPQPIPRHTSLWRQTLQWVTQQCAAGPVVVAGDFNASVDNFGGPGLGGCRDVGIAQHAGSVGTWPTALPTLLSMPIDHVLTTPAAGAVQSFTVLTSEDGSGARHRPTFTVLRP
jgi:endonuclease/exonuclease/phosphatase (EEP) superfamily protein YafD